MNINEIAATLEEVRARVARLEKIIAEMQAKEA